MSNTDRFRAVATTLFFLVVVVAVVGWAWLERDPSQLSPVIGWLTAAVATGEFANVGKRATFKKEAVED